MKNHTKFLNFIGYSPRGKILEWMLVYRKEFTLNDVVSLTKINRSKGYKILHKMADEGIIENIYDIKNLRFWMLNIGNKKVAKLIDLFEKVTE